MGLSLRAASTTARKHAAPSDLSVRVRIRVRIRVRARERLKVSHYLGLGNMSNTRAVHI